MENSTANPAADHTHSSTPVDRPSWLTSFATLIQSRIELFRLESHDAQKILAAKAANCVLAIISVVTAWACLLVGLIGGIAHFTPLPWWAVTLILGLFHLIVAVIAAKKVRSTTRPLYPVTRGEFKKDKLWMQTLKKSKHR